MEKYIPTLLNKYVDEIMCQPNFLAVKTIDATSVAILNSP